MAAQAAPLALVLQPQDWISQDGGPVRISPNRNVSVSCARTVALALDCLICCAATPQHTKLQPLSSPKGHLAVLLQRVLARR